MCAYAVMECSHISAVTSTPRIERSRAEAEEKNTKTVVKIALKWLPEKKENKQKHKPKSRG